MRTFDFYGIGSDGTKLLPGEIYFARATGAPDPETGILRELADDVSIRYKAIRNGRLFTMWPQDFCTHGYTLPEYMEFDVPNVKVTGVPGFSGTSELTAGLCPGEFLEKEQ